MISRGHNCVQWRGASCVILANVLGIWVPCSCTLNVFFYSCAILDVHSLFMAKCSWACPILWLYEFEKTQFMMRSASYIIPWISMSRTLSLSVSSNMPGTVFQKVHNSPFWITWLSRNLVSWTIFLFTIYPSQSIIFQEFNIPVYTNKCLKNYFTVMPGAICGSFTSGDRIIIATWMVRWSRYKIQYYYLLSWTTPPLVTIVKIWLSQE